MKLKCGLPRGMRQTHAQILTQTLKVKWHVEPHSSHALSGLWRALEELVLDGKLDTASPAHTKMIVEASGGDANGASVTERTERVVMELSRQWGGDSSRRSVPGARNAESFCYGEALLAIFLYPSQLQPYGSPVVERSGGFRTLMRAANLWLSDEPESARKLFQTWVVDEAKVYRRGQMGNPTEVVDRFMEDGDDVLVDPALFFSTVVKQTCEKRCDASRALEDKVFVTNNSCSWKTAGIGLPLASLPIELVPSYEKVLVPQGYALTFAELWAFMSGERAVKLQRGSYKCACGSAILRRHEVQSAPRMLFFSVCAHWQTQFSFPGTLALRGSTYQLVGRIFCTHASGIHYFCRYLWRLHADDANPVVVHYDSLNGRGVVLGAYKDGAALLEGAHKLTTNVLYMRLNSVL